MSHIFPDGLDSDSDDSEQKSLVKLVELYGDTIVALGGAVDADLEPNASDSERRSLQKIVGLVNVLNPLYEAGGGGGGVTNTAYVSSTPGGTPELNSLANPYPSLADALAALMVEYPGEATTIYLLSDIAGTPNSNNLDQAISGGLTIRGHNNTIRTITGTMGGGSGVSANNLLILDYVTVASLVKPGTGFTGTGPIPGGTILGLTNVVLTSFTMGDYNGSAGSTGAAGGVVVGSPDFVGGNPQAGDDEGGAVGGDADASGADGGSGNDGQDGWEIFLAGVGTLTAVDLSGGNGGARGVGRLVGTATGGHGQNGGNASVEDTDGGTGGDGGGADATGGDGGTGGNAGYGGRLIVAGGWTVTSSVLTAGAAGAGGAAGLGGTANGGAGGDGGAGNGTGGQGPSGNSGSAADTDGAAGSAGTTPGVAGTIIP